MVLICLKVSPMFQFTHPGRGATRLIDNIRSAAECFNSRTPGGVRLVVGGYGVCEVFVFQFTHPGRGATSHASDFQQSIKVSIHAPREGCDNRSDEAASAVRRFNSRTPGGVRRAHVCVY